jgi:phenylalanyl-tRNA synthetase alpha chain
LEKNEEVELYLKNKKILKYNSKSRSDWDEYFMDVALLVSKRSTCIHRKVGAIIVKDKRILATGYNQPPSGFPHCDEIGCIRDDLNIKESWIDVTIPGSKRKIGKISLISKTIRDIEEIFVGMGFSVAEGPEIENSWYNFDALNTPEWHPAREMQDTFYLSNDKKYLLRTHTSPVQIRTMLSNKPPLAIISPGRVYRKDELDATHSPVFHQVEGLFIDKNVSIAHIKMYLEYLAKKLFGDKVTILLRPSYFPFTEPSFEVDISCIFCEGKGCNICKNSGWIEILGAGLVHPNVLKSVHYDPDVWQGFAFGMGVERIALLKYNVPEMREFYKNDIRFIEI